MHIAARGQNQNGASPAAGRLSQVFLVLWLGGCVICSAAGVAEAQVRTGVRLSANLRMRTTTARRHAPTTLVWELDWTGVELLEGYLDLTLHDGPQELAHLRTDDIVMSTGKRRLETRLPVIAAGRFVQSPTLRVEFVTPDRRIDLGERPLRFSAFGTRTLTVGICDPWGFGFSSRHGQLTQSLRLDRFKPQANDRSLSTSFGHVPPREMPADPLGYCQYNLLLLIDAGFAELRANQLQAISDWVRAGGSVCVMPGGGLTDDHFDFLNRLAAREAAPPFLPGPRGRLIPPGGKKTADIRLLYPGMGRAAIVLTADDAGRDPQSDDWRRMVAHLWSVRSSHVPTLVKQESWQGLGAIPTTQLLQSQGQRFLSRFDHRPISQGNWLLDRLMPESTQVVPLGLIGLILFGYVLLIGPVDYFVLGLLGQRKLTWVLFPLVTLGVTLFTVWLSQWYMQPADERRTVEFLDVGDDGGIVRASRFDLLFTGSPREVVTEVTGEIFAPFDHQRYRMNSPYGPESERLVANADYRGRIPSRYTVTQQIPQWTPQINRFFSIASGEESTGNAAGIDWNALRPTSAGGFRDAAWRERVLGEVRRVFGNTASTWVVSAGEMDQLFGRHGLFRRGRSRWRDPRFRQATATTAVWNPTSDSVRQLQTGDFLSQTCQRPPLGLFALVSRIAPTGGDNFEDLTVLDPGDPRQTLLVVAVEEEGTLKIYRKLYISK